MFLLLVQFLDIFWTIIKKTQWQHINFDNLKKISNSLSEILYAQKYFGSYALVILILYGNKPNYIYCLAHVNVIHHYSNFCRAYTFPRNTLNILFSALTA